MLVYVIVLLLRMILSGRNHNETHTLLETSAPSVTFGETDTVFALNFFNQSDGSLLEYGRELKKYIEVEGLEYK